MGLIKLFTNPAGFLKDQIGDRLKDKQKQGVSNLSKAARFIPGGEALGSVAGEAIGGIKEIGGKLGGLSEKREQFLGGLMEQALGEGEDGAQSLIRDKLSEIQGRELPSVEDYKPAGKAAEWMNRLGAGLYAAGGGNPEDIYRNFRAKEETKLARYTRQQENRQAAIEKQDTEVLGALEGIAGRGQQAATSISANIIQQQTSMMAKGAEAEIRAFENEADMAKMVLGMQADFEVQRQGHINRLQEMDKQGVMDTSRIEHAAALQIRNDFNSELLTYGMNPAGFEDTTNAYSRGDFGNMSAQDHIKLQLIGNLRRAKTDEEVKMFKLNAMVGVMGTRIHARDESTGNFLYQKDGSPVYTTLTTPESAGTYIWGSKQNALDAFANGGDIGAEVNAAQQFLENSGKVTSSPFHQQKYDETRLSGFSSTEDAAFKDMPEDPRDAAFQARNTAELWNDVAKDLDSGFSMKQVIQAMRDDGIASESIQMTMQRAMEFGYWDGQEDKDEINQLLTLGQTVSATGGAL